MGDKGRRLTRWGVWPRHMQKGVLRYAGRCVKQEGGLQKGGAREGRDREGTLNLLQARSQDSTSSSSTLLLQGSAGPGTWRVGGVFGRGGGAAVGGGLRAPNARPPLAPPPRKPSHYQGDSMLGQAHRGRRGPPRGGRCGWGSGRRGSETKNYRRKELRSSEGDRPPAGRGRAHETPGDQKNCCAQWVRSTHTHNADGRGMKGGWGGAQGETGALL